jgi:hypothetical protein
MWGFVIIQIIWAHSQFQMRITNMSVICRVFQRGTKPWVWSFFWKNRSMKSSWTLCVASESDLKVGWSFCGCLSLFTKKALREFWRFTTGYAHGTHCQLMQGQLCPPIPVGQARKLLTPLFVYGNFSHSSGRNLGIIGWDPSVSNSNRSHMLTSFCFPTLIWGIFHKFL